MMVLGLKMGWQAQNIIPADMRSLKPKKPRTQEPITLEIDADKCDGTSRQDTPQAKQPFSINIHPASAPTKLSLVSQTRQIK
jgi:hypothetical protein